MSSATSKLPRIEESCGHLWDDPEGNACFIIDSQHILVSEFLRNKCAITLTSLSL